MGIRQIGGKHMTPIELEIARKRDRQNFLMLAVPFLVILLIYLAAGGT